MANSGNDTIIKQPRWWSRRTKLERTLTLLAALSLILVLCLVVILAVVLSSDLGDRQEVCLTPGCVIAASNLISHMNPEVDPCEDFYEFACGKFLRTTKIPDDKVSVNTFSVINDELQLQIRNLLEGTPADDEPKPFKLARDFYKSCMNITQIEKDGTAPILKLIDELGQWPVLAGKNWNEEDFHWIDSMVKFFRAGYAVRYFMELSISPDIKNSTLRMITVDQPGLGLNREYLMNGKEDKLVSAYFDYMVDIAVLLGADREFAENEFSQSLEFETRLANISLPQEERRDANALYNAFTIQELTVKYPSVPWLSLINELLSPYTSLELEDVVVIYVPAYMEKFLKIMNNVPKRVQANYAMWRTIKDSISFTNDKLRQRQLVYSGVMAGITAHEPRWKECVSTVSGSLGIAVGAMYVRKHFDETSKEMALEMVKEIRNEFRRNLEEVDWMDQETRAAAVEKADKMASHIAYPQELMDNTKITEFYEGLELSPSMYLRSVLNFTKFTVDYSIKRLKDIVNRTEWSSHGQPAVVNAFYSSIENSIQFPAGVLQGDFFSSRRPRYMNYGAIGFIIAHEVTHGFDDQGSQFDKEGNLLNWWAENTKKRYLEKAQCIIDQYSNYTVNEVEINLNGINTQGENIADNGGLKEVYFAYLNWVKTHGAEPILPGLTYTSKQLFWLSAANIWCSVQRPEALKRQITLGVHSPGRFRVLGPMSNMPQFSQDFNCPLGSKMNPEHKCTVW